MLVFLMAAQSSIATQVATTETIIIANETPFAERCMSHFRYRFQNLTCVNEWLFNCSCNTDFGNGTYIPECDCEGDQLRIRERILDRINITENGSMFQVLNWFRHNE